jgi:hypothetical protein
MVYDDYPYELPHVPTLEYANTYIYVIRRRDTREVKIGRATDPLGRLEALQTAHGEWLELVLVIATVGRYENALHQRFASARKLGEWFTETPEISEWIKNERAIAHGQSALIGSGGAA